MTGSGVAFSTAEPDSRTGGRSQRRWPQPETSSAFADAAAFLERIGAGSFSDEVEEDRVEVQELDCGETRQQRPQRQLRRPSESLSRRLRNFLLRRPSRRQSASDASVTIAEAESGNCSELQDYVYTRWVFHRRWCGSPERSMSHDHLRCDAAAATSVTAGAAGIRTVAASSVGVDTAGVSRNEAMAVTSAGQRSTAMTKSASARMVRFRCPYDSTGSDQDSTLVSPYLTSAFTCLPLPPGGSVSSGYSSDRDTPPVAAAAAAAAAALSASSQHWVTREEDIDCLLLRRPVHAATACAARIGSGDDEDFDLAKLDVSAFFAADPSADVLAGPFLPPPRRQLNGSYRTLPAPPLPPRCQQNSRRLPAGDTQRASGAASVYYDPVAADEIDRLVGEVVRLGGSTWRRTEQRLH